MEAATLTDRSVRGAVVQQLDWDPKVDSSGIGVSAAEGTVVLTGYTSTYAGKLAAERAAKRVRGVRAVANEIEVRLRLERTDADIAGDVTRALTLHSSVPQSVQAVVHEGRVTLTGSVQWLYQKWEAEKAIRHIRGVRHIFNYINVVPRAVTRDVRHRIVEALHRNATLDATHIGVAVFGDTVKLTGIVSTWLQRETAERAAADAPGVTHVENRIVVEPQLPSLEDSEDVC